MYAAPRPIEKWAFDVDAKDAWSACIERLLHCPDGAPDAVEIVADQRRQESGGAETAMRFADRADRLRARFIVEQSAAAPIDLHVDESRQQYLPAEIHGDGLTATGIGGRNDGLDPPFR